MKVFVTGAGGQLGYDVMRELMKRGHDALGSGRRETSEFENYVRADITDSDEIKKAIYGFGPDAVIHAAGWTDVDGAEDESSRDTVMKTNAYATAEISAACRTLGCKMLYVSTDYVFDGSGDMPWRTDGIPAPLNFYGLSKLEGEKAVVGTLEKYFIVRTSWVFGRNGRNFVRTMLSLADGGLDRVRVVDDRIGSPTSSSDLAVLLADMIESEKYGIYHASNGGGYISWADLAEAVFGLSGKNVGVVRVSSDEYGIGRARRPLNSRLDCSKLAENGFAPLPDWKDALRRYLRNE